MNEGIPGEILLFIPIVVIYLIGYAIPTMKEYIHKKGAKIMKFLKLRKQRDTALKVADYQCEEIIKLNRKIKVLESRNEMLLEYNVSLEKSNRELVRENGRLKSQLFVKSAFSTAIK